MNPGEADAYVHAVARDWRTALLSAQDQALCIFAVKLTHSPSQMSSADLDALRGVGLDDRSIHDATQVIAYFNYINRVADALGVEVEDGIPLWGQ